VHSIEGLEMPAPEEADRVRDVDQLTHAAARVKRDWDMFARILLIVDIQRSTPRMVRQIGSTCGG
jgi:hypothetical protein